MLNQYWKSKIRKALDTYKDEHVVAEKLDISYSLVASVSISPRRLRQPQITVAMAMEHIKSFKRELPTIMDTFLTDEEKKVIHLKYFESESYDGIAARHSRSKNWAYSHVQSGLAKIKKAFLGTHALPSA